MRRCTKLTSAHSRHYLHNHKVWRYRTCCEPAPQVLVYAKADQQSCRDKLCDGLVHYRVHTVL